MNQMGYLFTANVFVWGAILFYIFGLTRRNNTLRRDLNLLKQALRKDTDS